MKKTPEELVRQSIIKKMIYSLGFPKSLISIEKKIGKRRYDLVCFTKEMSPLLLIECKAGLIKSTALSQAFGYNEEINAPFICVANEKEIETFWHGKNGVESVLFLPTFRELYEISGEC